MGPRTLARKVAAKTLSILTGGRTPVDVFNALAPRPPGIVRQDGLAYGPLARHRLDVYRPAGQGPWPLMVYFYGGGWAFGERGDNAFVGRAYASRGFLTVVPDYRLIQEAPFPAFLEDCAAAVAWAQRADLGADPRATLLAGHSAGAYNAAMLALDRRWLAEAGAAYGVAGWAGLCGPYDFLPLEPGPGLDTFGQVQDLAATQPINHVAPGAPATFLGWGDQDEPVPPRNSERLAERLRSVGARVEARAYRAGHAGPVMALAWPYSLRWPVLRHSAAFLHAAARQAA